MDRRRIRSSRLLFPCIKFETASKTSPKHTQKINCLRVSLLWRDSMTKAIFLSPELRTEPRSLNLLGKRSTTELNPLPPRQLFYRKTFHWGWLTVSEVQSIVIMAGSMAACRQTWCWRTTLRIQHPRCTGSRPGLSIWNPKVQWYISSYKATPPNLSHSPTT